MYFPLFFWRKIIFDVEYQDLTTVLSDVKNNCSPEKKLCMHKENLTIFFILEQESSAKFTSELKDQRGVDGMKLKLEAFFAGNPEPEVTWEGKDGKPIENSKNIFNGLSILSFPSNLGFRVSRKESF